MVLSELKFLTTVIAALLIGWGGWRTVGRMAEELRPKEGSELTAEVLKAQKRD
jgi:hypothetical protein